MADSEQADPNEERRRERRRSILETFSVYVTVPEKGDLHRLRVHDLSESGIFFDLDLDLEEPDDFPVEDGTALDIELFLNERLSIPLRVYVRRIETHQGLRQIGAELLEGDPESRRAVRCFLEVLDALERVGTLKGH